MILGVAYLLFFSNRFIVNEALLLWEVPPTPLSQIHETYQAGIVLGGVTNTEKEPRDRVYFFRGADRITHTVRLYKMGLIRRIVVSGGSSNLINTKYKEADNLSRFLQLCGVAGEDIFVEDKARNTRENALYSAGILLDRYPPDSRYLVITSAFHLRRALGCFRKAGLNTDGFSTDFHGIERHFTPDNLLIPDPTAFADWQMIIREIFGVMIYKLAGYM